MVVGVIDRIITEVKEGYKKNQLIYDTSEVVVKNILSRNPGNDGKALARFFCRNREIITCVVKETIEVVENKEKKVFH